MGLTPAMQGEVTQYLVLVLPAQLIRVAKQPPVNASEQNDAEMMLPVRASAGTAPANMLAVLCWLTECAPVQPAVP